MPSPFDNDAADSTSVMTSTTADATPYSVPLYDLGGINDSNDSVHCGSAQNDNDLFNIGLDSDPENDADSLADSNRTYDPGGVRNF